MSHLSRIRSNITSRLNQCRKREQSRLTYRNEIANKVRIELLTQSLEHLAEIEAEIKSMVKLEAEKIRKRLAKEILSKPWGKQ